MDVYSLDQCIVVFNVSHFHNGSYGYLMSIQAKGADNTLSGIISNIGLYRECRKPKGDTAIDWAFLPQ